MTDTIITGIEQIGSVVSLNGSAWAINGDTQRPLVEGSPVYEGEEIVTESDSNLEIQFADNTILGQGEDSSVRLDDYVYTDSENSLDFHMLKGAMRVVSGEIVKANPEGFNLTTPLATIGIRGTEVMIQVDEGREIIGVDQLGEGHTVIVKNAFNEVVIDHAGMFSGVDFDGSLIVPDEMPDHFIETMIKAAPLTLLGDDPRSMSDPQDIIPPQFYQTIDNQTGEYRPGMGMEPEDQPQSEFDDTEDLEDLGLDESEIAEIFAIETAEGDDGDNTEPLQQIVDVQYTPPENQVTGGGDESLFGGQSNPPQQSPDTSSDDDPIDTTDDTTDSPLLADDATFTQSASDESATVSYNLIDEGDASGSGVTLVSAELDSDGDYSGDLSFDSDGTVTYDPADGEEGTVLVNYTVQDSSGTTATSQLTITLADDSEPDITTSNVSGDEDNGLVTTSGTLSIDYGADAAGASVALSATDATWDSDSQTLTADDDSWTVTLDGEGGYEFTQNSAFDHTDNDSYVIDVGVTATDGDGTVSTGSFSVTVDDADPSASDATYEQANSGDTITYNVLTEGDASAGTDGGSLLLAWIDDSDFSGQLSYDANGAITYIPADSDSGTVPIKYLIEDDDGDQAEATFSITLAAADEGDVVDDVLGGQGGDVSQGSGGDDTISGGGGRDVVYGSGGDDSLTGDNSPDALFGAAGDDTLDGGRGGDSLVGGAGDDVLTGGAGNDTFVLDHDDTGSDSILDFGDGNDIIALDDFSSLSAKQNGNIDGKQFTTVSSDTFSGGHDFQGASSGIVYASEDGSSTGKLYYDPDDTTDGDEVLLATVTEDDGQDVSASDIEIV